MASLGIAIAGAGLMGRWHAHVAQLAGARVVAVADPDPAAARELARSCGANAVASLDDCLAITSPAIDAVHLCTPLATHAILATRALEAGKHLLVEKPLAPTSGETGALLGLARKRGLVLCPVHQFAWQSGVRELVKERARLGEIVRIAFTTCSAGGEGFSRERRRQILLEILPHPASLLHLLQGGAGDLAGWQILASTDDDLELGRRSGATQEQITISLRGRPTRAQLVVVGTKATAHADLFHGFSFVEDGKVSRTRKALAPFGHAAKLQLRAGTNLVGRAVRREPAYPGLRELVAAFHAAVRGEGPAPVTEAEALGAAALMERVARGA